MDKNLLHECKSAVRKLNTIYLYAEPYLDGDDMVQIIRIVRRKTAEDIVTWTEDLINRITVLVAA
jgi:hypothetical protein